MGVFDFRKKESIEYIIQRMKKKLKPDEAEKFLLSSDDSSKALELLLFYKKVEFSQDILNIFRKHPDWVEKESYEYLLKSLDEDILCDPKNNDILEKIIVSVDRHFYGRIKSLKNPKLVERLIYLTKGEIIKYTDVKTLEDNLYLIDDALDAGLNSLREEFSYVDKENLKSKVIIRRLIEKKATSCLKSISGDFYKSNPDILDEMIKNDIYIEPYDVEIVERYIELGKPNIIDFFYKIDKYPELIKKAIEKGYLNRDSRNRVASVILSSSSLSRQYVESNCEKGYSLIDEICLNLRRKESLGGNEFQTVRFLLKSGHGNLLVRIYSGYKVMFSNETINLLIDGDCPNIINYLEKEKLDEEIINKALEKGFSVDKDISDNVVGYLSLHPELVLDLIKRGNGNAFLCFKDDEQYLTQENLEFALQNGLNDEKVKAYWHNKELADMLKKDQRYVLKFVQNGGVNAINYLNEKSLTEHPELVELCLNNGLEKIDSYPLYKVINSNSEYLKKAVSMGLITSSVVKSNVDYINMYLDYIGKSYISIQNSSSGISKTAFDFFNSIPVSVLKDNPEIIKRFIENIHDKEHLSDYQFNFSPFIINTILNNSELLDYYISVCPAFINEIENPTREQVLSYVRIWRDFGYQANDKVRKKLEEIFNDDFDLLIEYSNYTEGRIVAFAGETLLAAHPELFTGNVARVAYGAFYDAGIIGYAGNGFQKVIGSNVSLIRRYMKSSGGYVINLATEDILKEHPELIEEAFAAGYRNCIEFANKRSIIDYNPELIKKINLRDIKKGDAVLREYIFESRELLEYFSSEDNNCLLLDCTPRGFFDNPDNKWLLEKAKERSYVITDSTPEYIVDILYENGFDINISEKSSDKLKNLFWEKAKEKPSLISNLSYPLMLENLDLILNILNKLSNYDKLQIIFGGNEYQNFQSSTGISEVVNDERILKILINSSFYFSKLAVFINFEKLKNNEELMSKFILTKLKSYTPIDFEVENYIDTKFQLVYKFIDEGYYIMDSSPSVFKQFKYIKYAVEKGQKSAIDYLDISSINDNEKQELDKLVFKLIDNGYKIFNNSPNYIKQFKYIKYAVENGQRDAINYLDVSLLNETENYELDSVIRKAINNGYVLETYLSYEIRKRIFKQFLICGRFISLKESCMVAEDLYKDFDLSNYEIGVIINNIINNSNYDISLLDIYMFILKKYSLSGINDDKLNKYYEYILSKVKSSMNEKFKDEANVNMYISKVMSVESLNPLNFEFIMSNKDLRFVTTYNCDLVSVQASENNSGITNEILDKGNVKQIKKIIELLKGVGISNEYIPLLAINVYMSLDFNRAKDLLSGKYGDINVAQLLQIFKNIIPSNVLFVKDGNGFKPQFNEQLINLVFGANYNISNTLIKNYLNNCHDKEQEINGLKEKINSDMSLTSDEKKEKVHILDEQMEKYVSELNEFFTNFSSAFNEWDIIEEEFLKSTTKSSLKLKLNLSKVNEICKLVKSKRNVPNLDVRDELLVQSDVFDYAFHDTQFVSDSSKVPSRVIELSRRMDRVRTKKFPNVEVAKGKYTIKTYGPQDRRLLSAGYRSHCCFRARGNADNSGGDNSLLNYCTSTEYGGGVEIFDSKGETIMFSPLLRNGNVLMIHSVETSLGGNLPSECYQLLVDYANEVINKATEFNDDISFVTITDLHYLDKSFTKGQLPSDKKFFINDTEQKFDGMYTNLNCNHMILANREGKKVDDIVYGEVSVDYDFDLSKVFGVVSVDEQEKQIIYELDRLKGEYTNIANKRHLSMKNGDEKGSYSLLSQIKDKKNEYLKKYKELVKIHSSSDIYSDYKKAVRYISSVNEQLGIKVDESDIFEATYSTNWYIIITKDNQLIANALEDGKEDMLSYLNKMKEVRNFSSIRVFDNKDSIDLDVGKGMGV